MTAIVSKVPLVLQNVGKCLCPGCPVQATSACVVDLKKGLTAALARKPLRREDLPALYCGTGKATCADIDTSRGCLCGGCPVHAEYRLKGGKFCKAGAAQ
jgi:hypothetical protein